MDIIKKAYLRIINLKRAYHISKIRRTNGGKSHLTYSLPCGYDIELSLDEQHITPRLLFTGKFEPEVSVAILALIRPGMTVLDIGANIGIHTLQLAKLVGKTGQVIAFEPNPAAREALQRNLSLNAITNVTVREDVLWEQDGEEIFCFPEVGSEAMGGLRKNLRYKVAYERKIDTRKLDTLLPQIDIKKVDFMKLDVEGAELQVLRGASMLLEQETRPTILYESLEANTLPYSYTPPDLYQFLLNRGYTIDKIDHEDYLALPLTY